MYCIACGKKCPDGARFCAWCGEKFPDDLSLEPSAESAASASAAPIPMEAANEPSVPAPEPFAPTQAAPQSRPEQVGLDIDRLEFGLAGQESPVSDDGGEPAAPKKKPINPPSGVFQRPAAQFSRVDEARTVRPLPPNPAQPPRGEQAEEAALRARLQELEMADGAPDIIGPPVRRADRKTRNSAQEAEELDPLDDLDAIMDEPLAPTAKTAGGAQGARGGLNFLRNEKNEDDWGDERREKPRGLLGLLWPGKAEKDSGSARPAKSNAPRPEKPDEDGLDGARPAKPHTPRPKKPDEDGLDGARPAKPREDLRFARPEKSPQGESQRPAKPREDLRFARPEKSPQGERPAKPHDDPRYARPGNSGREDRDGARPVNPARGERAGDPRGGADRPRPARSDRGKAVTASGGMVTPPSRRAPIASMGGLRPPRKPKNDLFFEDLETPKENYYDEAAEEWALSKRIKGIVALALLIGIAVIAVWLMWMPGGQLFRARWNMGAPATAYKALGDQERANGQIPRAADAYHNALRLDPDNYEYALLVGQTQDIIGNWKSAAKAYMLCVKLKPQAVQPYKLLMDLYTIHGDAQMAESWRAEGYLQTSDETLAPPAS